MAASTSKPRLTAPNFAAQLSIVFLLLLLLMAAATPAKASRLTVYRSRGCSGLKQQYVLCHSCYNITLTGGYRFDYRYDQAAVLYQEEGCSGLPIAVLTTNALRCTSFTPKSVVITCGNLKNIVQEVAGGHEINDN